LIKTYLEQEDISRLEQAALSLRDRLLIRTLFHLGCRISEALALTTNDIDFTQRTVMIIHLKRRIRISCTVCGSSVGRNHKYCPRCGGRIDETDIIQRENRRQRLIPIDVMTLNMFDEYLKTVNVAVNSGLKPIFGINRHRAWQIVKQCSEKAGLPKLVNPETGKVHNVSPHKLRDAFAVHAVKRDDSGDGLRMLQEHLGHQSFNTTAKYRKVAGEEHQEWYQKLWDTSPVNNGPEQT
jgi:integrase/recombinase XerD